MQWTSDDVLARLIEAVDVIETTTSRDQNTARGAWPAYLHDYSDLREWADEWRKETFDRWARAKERFTPAQIARADEAAAWFPLVDDELSRKILLNYAWSRAKARPFSVICRKKGWIRRTADRKINKSLQDIASSLCLSSTIRHEAASSYVSQIEGKRGMRIDRVARSASHWRDDDARPHSDNVGTDPDTLKWQREQQERRRRKRKKVGEGVEAKTS